MAYSIDLRERVVSYVKSGGSRISASSIYTVSERTVRRWLQLESETGSVSSPWGV
jgi:transposase